MRQIKFRSKTFGCLDESEWKYGIYIPNNCTILDESGWRYVVDDDTVGQYTGLKDKNGVEIYEGDTVRFNNQIGEVVFENGTFGILFKYCIHWEWLERNYAEFNRTLPACYNDHFISFTEIYQICDCYDVIEVIGNIYDSPELLEVEE